MNFVTLRPETPKDYCAVETLTREAFWNYHVPGCCEHYLAHILRSSDAFLPQLDFVAVADDQIVGNIMYTKGRLLCDDGTEREVLSFGPIAVLPAFQRQGIGRRLIEHTKAMAAQLGYRAIFIYGDPAFYTKTGFVPAQTYGVGTADHCYADALLACELQPGALTGCSGRFVEAPVYDVDALQAEAFDANFPQKKKEEGLPSQLRFLSLVSRRTPRP